MTWALDAWGLFGCRVLGCVVLRHDCVASWATHSVHLVRGSSLAGPFWFERGDRLPVIGIPPFGSVPGPRRPLTMCSCSSPWRIPKGRLWGRSGSEPNGTTLIWYTKNGWNTYEKLFSLSLFYGSPTWTWWPKYKRYKMAQPGLGEPSYFQKETAED